MTVFLDKLVCIRLLCLPSRPIEGQKKTFEELLEEQLRLEEQRLKSAQQQQVRKFNNGLHINSEKKNKKSVSTLTLYTVFKAREFESQNSK